MLHELKVGLLFLFAAVSLRKLFVLLLQVERCEENDDRPTQAAEQGLNHAETEFRAYFETTVEVSMT